MPNRNKVAAYFHNRMCIDSRFGYTQGSGRWGSGNIEYWEYDGVVGRFRIGDRDCSSSTIDCWREALRGSKYEGVLDNATYTGDMRSVFVDSGLFEWKPMSFKACPGDLYLSEQHHVAMCQTQVPDVLSEFLSNEWGGITGGQVGDQTGGESVVRAFWWPSFGWDGILHYNGKADDEENDMTPEQAEQLKFIYDHLHWDEQTHFSHLGNLVSEFPVEYETIDENGNRSPLTQPLGKRIGYIDQRVHVVEAQLNEILETLENISDHLNLDDSNWK